MKVSIILARYSFGIRLSSERCGFSAFGVCSVSDTKETFPASRKQRRSSSQANGINRIVSLLTGNIGARSDHRLCGHESSETRQVLWLCLPAPGMRRSSGRRSAVICPKHRGHGVSSRSTPCASPHVPAGQQLLILRTAVPEPLQSEWPFLTLCQTWHFLKH